jgi:hypothetical protein
MPLTVAQIRGAVTSNPWTKDFRHLQPFPVNYLKRYSFKDMRVRAAKPKDRIKYWNIVPGDRVRIRGDKDGKILEVAKINKLSNFIYLKGTTAKVRNIFSLVLTLELTCVDYNQRVIVMPGLKMFIIHDASYSLEITSFLPKAKLRSHERFRTSDFFVVCVLIALLSSLSVFANRIGTSTPYWQPMGARYEWERFAVATTPRLPDATSTPNRIKIPWPKRPERPKYEGLSFFFGLYARCTMLNLMLKLQRTPRKRKT